MEFRLTPEEERLRQVVEEFVRDELIPLEPDFANGPDIFEGSRWKSRVKKSQDTEIRRYIAIMEALEKKIRGEKTSAFGLSEPASGADPSMLQTTATPDGDDFIINGTKMFPTFADVADFVQLFARLPGTKGREGVTCFLIDTGTSGYQVARSIATIAGTEPCELVFENCRVHKSQVLGEIGNGWALNQAWLGARRFQVGIRAHGKAERVLHVVRDLVRHEPKDAEQFAGRVGYFLGEIEALRTLTYLGAWKADQKMDVRSEAANVKLFATELLHRVTDFALEVGGQSALRKNHALARTFRHARATRIVEGPSEIQRHIIQRELFRDGAAILELQ